MDSMRKIKQYLEKSLITLGLFAAFFGIIIGQTEHNKVVCKWMAPAYSEGMRGFSILMDVTKPAQQRTLAKTSPGFDVLSDVIVNKTGVDAGPRIDNVGLVKSIRGGQFATFANENQYGALIFIVHDNTESSLPSYKIQKVLEKMFRDELNRKRLWISIGGFLVAFISGVSKIRGNKNKTSFRNARTEVTY